MLATASVLISLSSVCDFLSTAHYILAMTGFSKSYMEWIWRSSQGQQRLKEKPEFSEPMHRLWARAFDDALAYASRNNRSYTKMVVEEQLLNQGRPYRRVGFLKPGTFVWALLTTHPVGLCLRNILTTLA